MTNNHQTISAAGRLTRLAWLPIPLLLAAMGVLWAADVRTAHESEFMLMAFNFVFSTLASALVVVLIGRSYLVRGSPGLLLLGCGVAIWGAAGTLVPVLFPYGTNALVGGHNSLVWFSALCQLAGVLLSLRPRRPPRLAGLTLAIAYTGAICLVWLVVLLAVEGWMPLFFVQGQGGTPLRDFVLGSAIVMFALTAAVLWRANRPSPSAFVRWYGAALLLVATGLLGIMLESVHGGALSWAGRAAQFLGGAYMLAAAIASVRESGGQGVSLSAALREAQRQYEELFDLAGDGIVLHELVGAASRGNFIRVNPAICRMLGYTPDEMRELTPLDIMAPEARQAVPEDAAVMARDGLLRHEKTLLGRDGRRIPAEITTRQFMQDGRQMVMSVIRDITERKRAEEAVWRSQETFAELVERSPFGTYVVDSQFRIAMMNASSQTGAFRNVRPVIGRPFEEAMRILWPEPVAMEIIGHFRHTLDSGEPYYSRDFIEPRHDADTVEAYEWELHRMTLPDGKFGVICYYFDSTKLREAEAAERASRAKLAAAFASMTEAIFIADAEGRLTDFNDEFVRYHRFKDRDECSRTIADCPKYLEAYFADGTPAPPEQWAMPRALRGEKASNVEYRLRRKETGETWWGSYSFAPIKAGDGGIVGAIVSARETTALKQAEAALRASEAKWNTAIENFGEGAIIATAAEQVIYWNPAARAMHGFKSVQEGIGPLKDTPDTFQLWTPDGSRLLALEEWPMRRIKRGETVRDLELRLRRPDQGWEKIVSYSGAMVETASGERLIFLSVHDLTDQRKAEEALSRSRVAALNLMKDAVEARNHAQQAGADLARSVASLRAANDDLARFNSVAVGRELRMIELKKQVNELCAKLGQAPKYQIEIGME